MIRARVVPVLLLKGDGLVKTVKFRDPLYVGDPINTIKIFNEKEADELMLLDIDASRRGSGPAFDVINEIASECFMPLGYGGGIRSLDDIRKILALGVEKVVLNTAALRSPNIIAEASQLIGSQSVVVSIDVRRKMFGGYEVYGMGGREPSGRDPVTLAREMQSLGAGELLLNSIDRDGTRTGFDLELVRTVAMTVDIPVVACGGAGQMRDLRLAIDAGASAVAAGSMFVYLGKHRAVMISYPTRTEIEGAFR